MVQTEKQAKTFVAERSSIHQSASHNCWAYSVGLENHPLEYFSDDGEPSGSAGKPILGAIERLQLLNTVVVVTRYFGGTKLGVRGLIDAYGKTASICLENSGIYKYEICEKLIIRAGYSEWNRIEYELNNRAIPIDQGAINFKADVSLSVLIPLSKKDAINHTLSKYKKSGLTVEYEWSSIIFYNPVKAIQSPKNKRSQS